MIDLCFPLETFNLMFILWLPIQVNIAMVNGEASNHKNRMQNELSNLVQWMRKQIMLEFLNLTDQLDKLRILNAHVLHT